ncbi:SDR family NAD(P)-dependent oxidoreductase [Rhodococcus sp. (in: high G+C Gram-positive bacteria)]|uniref:SDR family NAD(P)-dependent oxidoreductase n=1 Tax=Rhodococcus sp. TaxID=1831 RepID=UPI00257D94E2|nr:SDR family NAD(P)-dependent oxidoreductase [Rhodococcus sp. (in: high G+C Gram-positive bacteria)]MBQ7805750.1 SDR family NAD(P)-dependent oxidoreductase [Rhodococcus sp. (in: high G+C Gram-positive bacteria)]
MNVNGSVALVTGAASGLGLATAMRLHSLGARVVGIDLPSSIAQASERGVDFVTFMDGDVRDEEAVARIVTAAGELGDLRVVVNCAGVGDPARTVGRNGAIEMERFRRVVDINLFGTFNVVRLAAEQMSKIAALNGERGVIVNTASVAAYDGQIGQASYAASKGAIAAMTLPLARDLASRLIRVATVAPGMFDTPILQGLSAQARDSISSQVPHPTRLGDPTEFADLVAHIVSNPMLNGETIRLDGAIRMGPR